MVGDGEASGTHTVRLGVALRHAWVGYRRQLDRELAAAGFGDRGFADGRVLRLCTGAADVTISHIGREKIVKPTGRAVEFLGAQREAAQRIEAGIYAELGPDALDGLYRLLDALGVEYQPRGADYLRHSPGLSALLE